MDDMLHLSHSQKIRKMLEEGHMSDCKFIVGPDDETAENVFGNKCFLAMESPVMESLLFGDFTEARGKSETRIIDANANDFKVFCTIIYERSPSYIIKLPIENMINIFQLFDKYMVSSMSKMCADHIDLKKYLVNTPIESLLTIFEFACNVEERALFVAVKNEICRRNIPTGNVLNMLSEKAFYNYIRITYKPDRTYQIFLAIENYFIDNNLVRFINNNKEYKDEHEDIDVNNETREIPNKSIEHPNEDNPAKKIKQIQDLKIKLLKFIDFRDLTYDNIQQCVKNSKVLNGDQKLYIYYNIVDTMLLSQKNCHYGTHGSSSQSSIKLYKSNFND